MTGACGSENKKKKRIRLFSSGNKISSNNIRASLDNKKSPHQIIIEKKHV
jgi:hypothetical protein